MPNDDGWEKYAGEDRYYRLSSSSIVFVEIEKFDRLWRTFICVQGLNGVVARVREGLGQLVMDDAKREAHLVMTSWLAEIKKITFGVPERPRYTGTGPMVRPKAWPRRQS